jgi:DNA-binding XRE family transcriptional regulator
MRRSEGSENRVSAQISPEISTTAYAELARVTAAQLLGLDAVLYVRFGDGLERAVPWTSLPFARALALEPSKARVGHDGETVVMGDEAGREVDVSAQSLRAALDDQYREALRRTDDGERKLVGARIRTFREGAGLSQLELSRRSGIAQESLSRIETGRSDPRLGTLRRLAQGMGLSLNQLLKRLSTDV